VKTDLPLWITSLTNNGDIIGSITTAVRKPDGSYTHYNASSFILSGSDVTMIDNFQTGGTDDARRVPGERLLYPVIRDGGQIRHLPIPHGDLGSAAWSSGDRVVGSFGFAPAEHVCVWAGDKLTDLSSLIPAATGGGSGPARVDAAGDILVSWAVRNFTRYFLIRADRTTIDLHAVNATMNNSGEIVLQRQVGGKAQVAIYSCRTGKERVMDSSLTNGAISGFNDRGALLITRYSQQFPYPSPVAQSTASVPVQQLYYLYSSGRLTRVELPITAPPKNFDFGPSGLYGLNDRGQIAGEFVEPDGKVHILLFTPT
jgi:hypothetical protein